MRDTIPGPSLREGRKMVSLPSTYGAIQMEFEKVKSITRPVIKFNGTPTIVQITGKIYLGEKIDGGTAAQKAMEPPHMAEAIDMATGTSLAFPYARMARFLPRSKLMPAFPSSRSAVMARKLLPKNHAI